MNPTTWMYSNYGMDGTVEEICEIGKITTRRLFCRNFWDFTYSRSWKLNADFMRVKCNRPSVADFRLVIESYGT